MVDSIKGGSFVDGAKEAGKAMAKAAAEAVAKAAAAAAAEAAKAAAENGKSKAPSEGFDAAKKKPLSITGKHKPPEAPAPNASLQDEVAQARLAATAGGASKPVTMTPGPSGVNKTDSALPSASGKISKAEWDNPQKLLSKLTQYPSTGPAGNSSVRCGPSGVMAASLMQGPDATAKYLTSVADAPKNNRLTDAEKTELKGLADKVKNKEATFEDLGRAQDLTYKSGNRVAGGKEILNEVLAPENTKLADSEKDELKRLMGPRGTPADIPRVNELLTKGSGHPTRMVKDPDSKGYLLTVEGSRSATDKSAYTDREVAELAEIGGTFKGTAPMESLSVKGIFKDLKPGESAVIRVSATPPDEVGQPTSNPNHFVTIGRRKDGTAFIYNSDPAKGDSTLFVGGKGAQQSAAFAKELAKYEERTGADPGTGHQPKVILLKAD